MTSKRSPSRVTWDRHRTQSRKFPKLYLWGRVSFRTQELLYRNPIYLLGAFYEESDGEVISGPYWSTYTRSTQALHSIHGRFEDDAKTT